LTISSWLPLPWLQIQEAVPLELKDQDDYRTIVSLGGRSRLVHDYTLYCRRRGYYTVGPLSLRTSDLFGFVEARWEEAGSAEFHCLPADRAVAAVGLAQPDALWRARCAPSIDRRPGAAERRAHLCRRR
jgi:uncharacterized protein (DUF58 family)